MEDEMKTELLECPNCGSKRVESRTVRDVFQYGEGPKAVQLEAAVPFRKCADCGFEFTDAEAEDLRHDAICQHLGLMTPSEIIALRKELGLTRAQFAERSRIGEASLARWETGQLIQNAANDNYMYLLKFAENWERVHTRQELDPGLEEPKRT
jgi:putative zinc finger/helix-turn-helix YgiT family protein